MEGIDILTAISTVGFPIVACCAMFWLYTKMLPVMTELSANTKDMKETLDKVKDSLDIYNSNFTEIFNRLNKLELRYEEMGKDASRD
mgnify:CR=1 FL=1